MQALIGTRPGGPHGGGGHHPAAWGGWAQPWGGGYGPGGGWPPVWWPYEASDDLIGASVAAFAPAAGGVSCEMELAPDLRLHVAITAGGQRHETSVDLSGILSEIAGGVARRYAAQWRAAPGSWTPHPTSEAATREVSARTEKVVESAGMMLVGALYERHVGAITAGFWDSLKSAYRTVSSPVTWFNKKVAKVLQTPGIKEAVTMVATGVATAYGGPAAGAAASKLVGPIIDSSAETGGDPTKLFEKTKQRAHQHSGGDPKVAQAVDHAHRAITQTAAAYTLKTVAAEAQKGDPEAVRRIGELQQAAQAGDEAASRAMEILAELQRPVEPAVTGLDDAVYGRSIFDMRRFAAAAAAQTRAAHGSGDAVLFVVSPRLDAGYYAMPVETLAAAHAYMRRFDPRTVTYLAVLDVSDPDVPAVVAERTFSGRVPRRR